MRLFYGVPEDIENWMSLVTRVRWNFPGLETQEKLDEHKATVLRFMGKQQAILNALNALRNKLLAQDRYTDAVDDVLIKVVNAPIKKFKIKMAEV